MTQYQVTLNEQTLQRLFRGDGQLAQLLETILNQVLEVQVGEHLQAGRYERTEERRGYRNGYKPRQLTTRVGTRTLRVPQVCESGFSPELFARYQRSEQALILTLMEMVVNGVSTRKVARITEELCGTSFAKSTVSEQCQGLDPLVAAWNERELGGTRYPFVLVDALLVKVRKGGRGLSVRDQRKPSNLVGRYRSPLHRAACGRTVPAGTHGRAAHSGRLEERQLRASAALSAYLGETGWTDVGWSWRWRQWCAGRRNPFAHLDARCGTSSRRLPPTVSPLAALQVVRRHWHIKNRLH